MKSIKYFGGQRGQFSTNLIPHFLLEFEKNIRNFFLAQGVFCHF